MLLLCLFLMSCCFSGSTGSATEEFQAKFKALVDVASKEILIPVPARKFQCNHVPCQLQRTIEGLKRYFKNDQMRAHISLLEKNVDSIISSLNRARSQPEKDCSRQMKEVSLQRALTCYKRFFQNLHEMC